MAACGTRWLSTTSIFSRYPIWGCENSFIVCFCCGMSDCHPMPMGQLTCRAPRELEKQPQPIRTITSMTTITPRQKCHKLGTPKSQLSQGWWYIPWYVQLYIIHIYIYYIYIPTHISCMVDYVSHILCPTIHVPRTSQLYLQEHLLSLSNSIIPIIPRSNSQNIPK